jgi:hypothetical protein
MFISGWQPTAYLIFVSIILIIAVLKDLELMVKQNISAEKAAEILKMKGLILTEKEVKEILDFLYKMAKLEVKEMLNK